MMPFSDKKNNSKNEKNKFKTIKQDQVDSNRSDWSSKSKKLINLISDNQSGSPNTEKTDYNTDQSQTSSQTSSQTDSSRGSSKKNSLLNIFNNRNTNELDNLKTEAKIMNFDSENLSNEEIECKYNVFCNPSPEKVTISEPSKETFTQSPNALNEMTEEKIRIIKLIDKIYKDIRTIRRVNSRCEKSFNELQEILRDFF